MSRSARLLLNLFILTASGAKSGDSETGVLSVEAPVYLLSSVGSTAVTTSHLRYSGGLVNSIPRLPRYETSP